MYHGCEELILSPLISSTPLCSFLPRAAWRGGAAAPEVGRAGRAEEGTQRGGVPCLEGAHCALVACVGVEGGSWGCSLEEGKMGWEGADWEEGRWLGEGLEAGGFGVDRRAGGKGARMKEAWARKRVLRSSSWTADSETPPRTCTSWK